MKTSSLIIAGIAFTLGCTLQLRNPIDAAESAYRMPGILSANDIAGDIDPESLARLPRVEREDLNDEGKRAFDTYVSPGTGYETGLRGPIGMWMHSPVLAQAMFDVRERVRYGTAKDQRLTELTIITAAREFNNQYEYTAHEPLAISAGLEQDIIDIVRFRQPLDSSVTTIGLGDKERTIIHFTRELVSEEKVSSGTFEKAIQLFGREGVVDLAGLVGYYSFVAMTLKTFDVQRPVGSELLLPTLIN